MIDQDLVIRVAARYGIPPAILSAALQHGSPDGVGEGRVPEHVVAGSGFNPGDVAGDTGLQVEIVARSLATGLDQTGHWESALSAYYSGDPAKYASETSPVAGDVHSTLTIAGLHADLGSHVVPMDRQRSAVGTKDFHHWMTTASQHGGAITPQMAQAYSSIAARDGEAMPFDPKYDQVSQPFGPSDLPGEPAAAYGGHAYLHFHQGTDYQVPDKSPLFALGSGTVVKEESGTWGPGGNEITVRLDDGSTVLYGHDSAFTVHEGDRVNAGQQIAVSGGAGEAGSGYSTGAHLHLEMRDAQGQLVNADPLVQQIAAGAGAHPQATSPHPELAQGGGGAQQQQATPTGEMHDAVHPSDVEQFKQRMNAAGVHDPDHFIQNYEYLSGAYRRLLQKNVSPEEYALMQHMDQPQMMEYIRSQPHPVYNVPVGALDDMMNKASLHSVRAQGRMPYRGEVARLVAANAGWRELAQYYTPPQQAPSTGEMHDTPQQAQQPQQDDQSKQREGGPQ